MNDDTSRNDALICVFRDTVGRACHCVTIKSDNHRELGWAADLGFNTVRVYLYDLVWHAGAEGFKERIDRYLDIAARHAIKTMFVLFDDCWNDSFCPIRLCLVSLLSVSSLFCHRVEIAEGYDLFSVFSGGN